MENKILFQVLIITNETAEPHRYLTHVCGADTIAYANKEKMWGRAEFLARSKAEYYNRNNIGKATVKRVDYDDEFRGWQVNLDNGKMWWFTDSILNVNEEY